MAPLSAFASPMQSSTQASLSSASAASTPYPTPSASLALSYHGSLALANAQSNLPSYWQQQPHPQQPLQLQQRGSTAFPSLTYHPSSSFSAAYPASSSAAQQPLAAVTGPSPHSSYYPQLHHQQPHVALSLPSSSPSPFLAAHSQSTSSTSSAALHHSASPATAAALYFLQPQHLQAAAQHQSLSHGQPAAPSPSFYSSPSTAFVSSEHGSATAAHAALRPPSASTLVLSPFTSAAPAPLLSAAFSLPFSYPSSSSRAAAAPTLTGAAAERGSPSASSIGVKRKATHSSRQKEAEHSAEDDEGEEEEDDDDEEEPRSSPRSTARLAKRESAQSPPVGEGGDAVGLGPYELELLQREVDELHDEAMAERLRAEDAETRYQRLVTQIRSMQAKLDLAMTDVNGGAAAQPLAAAQLQQSGAGAAGEAGAFAAGALRALTDVKRMVEELLSQVALDTEGVSASTSSITTASSVAHARLSRFMSKQVAQGESATCALPPITAAHQHAQVLTPSLCVCV